MIVVLKKHYLMTILLALIVSFTIFTFKNGDIVSTIALPITNKVIVIDAGHGGFDPGAVSKSGIREKDINIDIALKLQAFLEQSGCIVQLTRAEDESVGEPVEGKNTKKNDMQSRKQIVNSSQPNAFISIHLNSFTDSRYKGVQTFYNPENKESKKLSESIQKELKSALKITDNRVALKKQDAFMLKNNQAPAVIVECGFLSNSEEEKLLNNEMYRRKIAWGIYLGVMQFFKQ